LSWPDNQDNNDIGSPLYVSLSLLDVDPFTSQSRTRKAMPAGPKVCPVKVRLKRPQEAKFKAERQQEESGDTEEGGRVFLDHPKAHVLPSLTHLNARPFRILLWPFFDRSIPTPCAPMHCTYKDVVSWAALNSGPSFRFITSFSPLSACPCASHPDIGERTLPTCNEL
jgi:hypothetical protein